MPRTRSDYSLKRRREKAAEMFTKGYSNSAVARELQISLDTVARYRRHFEAHIETEAAQNPNLLRKVLENTIRSLEETDRIREEAWRQMEVTENKATKAQFLSVALKAQDQRAKLLGLMGVKQEVLQHVEKVRMQQEKVISFMQRELCPADRIKLETYLLEEFRAELDTLPTVGQDG